MHSKIEEIKKTESQPLIIKDIISEDEIKKFLDLYNKLPTTVHNTKQNVIKKRWLNGFGEELEKLFYQRLKNKIGGFKIRQSSI